MPKVSVIIPTYNNVQHISEAIQSVLDQTYQDFEMVIVDDGSTDNTKSIVHNFMTRFSDKVRYVYQDNKGLAVARNTAIKNAFGQYIALLDADDVWLPKRLQLGVMVLDERLDVGLVHANTNRISESGMPVKRPSRNKRMLSGMIFKKLFLREANISCPTVLFRRICIDEVGLFDENLARLGSEDRELWLRIAKKYKIRFIDEVVALYRMRTISMSNDLEKMLEAQIYVVNKNFPVDGPNQNMRNKALANIHRELGNEYAYLGMKKESKRHFRKALTHNPLSMHNWVNVIRNASKQKV